MASIVTGSPTSWVVTNDASANGGKAIYQAGANQTASSSSFALYSLVINQPGTYSVYYRWRADKAYTDADPTSANSFRLPLDWGDLENDSTSTNFATASVNNVVAVPAANSFNVFKDSKTYVVSDEAAGSGSALIFKIGTREAGMFIDRIVLSTSDTLSEADFNALANSDTEVVVQGAADSFIAFQAERVGSILAGSPTSWIVTNDAAANAGRAVFQSGANQTASPSSFALYSLRFSQPGTYSLYYRWRADKSYTDADPTSANSFRLPVDWGELENDSTSTNFVTASVNNVVPVPAANSFNVFKDSRTYAVSQEQVDAGTPLIFKIGTREAGMWIDRMIFSTSDALTEADINALPDSGSRTPPKVLSAVGSAALNQVTLSFDAPLAASSTNLSHFALSGGLQALGATLNPVTSRDIVLTTSAQTAGSNYVLTINGVVDVSGNQIVPDSKVSFTAWRLSAGWVTREIYFNVDTNNAGGGIADLLADAKYPNDPNVVTLAKGFQINNDITGNNYGARIQAFFIPKTAGAYDFFLYNDDAAQLSLSSDESPANLAMLVDSPAIQGTFDSAVMGTSAPLVVGRKYLLQVLYRQNTASALLGVAVRLSTDSTAPASLPQLGGDLIATYVNPDAGAITIQQQPAAVAGSEGSRAKFSVKATSLGPTLYYQWQRNGTDIAGATRAGYTTPVLTAADNGISYQVIISAAGNSVTSSSALLSVVSGSPSPDQPYIGINFVGTGAGGSGGGSGGVLNTIDVAGVVLQDHFNNISDTSAAELPLWDATGAASPVTLNFDIVANVTTGAGDFDAVHALFQGYMHNNNTPLTLSLHNIPAGTNYSLILYSLGFNYNTTYEEQIDLTGAITYPSYHVKAQDVSQYLASPGYVKMTSTNPDQRQEGNYVRYDNVSPAGDGSLVILITPESTNTGITYLPPLNALQLVKTTTITTPAQLTLTSSFNPTTSTLTVGWTEAAAGFTLESSSSVAQGSTWTPVAGTANPLTGAGSVNVPTSTGLQFYRLRK